MIRAEHPYLLSKIFVLHANVTGTVLPAMRMDIPLYGASCFAALASKRVGKTIFPSGEVMARPAQVRAC
ncbi:MAG: hypothetical protein QOD84_2045 [Acidobacteriaceae bacterium]